MQEDLPGRHPYSAGAHHVEGKLYRDVIDLILLNSRTPDERVGDLKAQFAANTVGMRSVLGLRALRRADTAATVAAYLDFTESGSARRSIGCPPAAMKPRIFSTAIARTPPQCGLH